MKKILFFLSLTSVIAHFPAQILAQTPNVSISGTACVGSILTVNSSIQPTKIVWKENGFPIDSFFNTWFSGGVTVAGQSNGTAGSAASQLSSPNGVFVDGNGNKYIADAANNRVQKWAPGATSGTTVAGGNGAGNSANQLNSPTGLFVDGSGNVYIADAGNNRVQEWASGATSGTTVAGQSNGSGGNAANQLSLPMGVYVDVSGNVYVSDYNNDRVQKWAQSASSGTTVAGGNGAGGNSNQLLSPSGIFVDGASNIYIADRGNNRVQQWALNATSGTTVAGGNGAGANSNQLSSPSGVFVDGNGGVYVADGFNNRIQLWAPGASNGVTIAGGNGVGVNNNQLDGPGGVFVDGFGNLYVADNQNNRVQEFAPTITYTRSALSSGFYTASVTTFTGASNTTSVYNVSDTLRPHMSIVFLPGPLGNTFCAGDTINFASSTTNGGASPSYQWMRNGLVIAGANGSAFSSHTLANNDSISCVLTPSTACPTLATDTSNIVTVTVNPIVMPLVTVTKNAGDTVCVGQTVVFSAFSVNGGNTPQYQWKINNVNLPLSTDSANYSTDTLHDGDVVTCFLTSNASCASTNMAFSMPLLMTVDSVVVPSINIFTLSGDTLCSGATLKLFSNVMNAGNNPQYQWYNNSYAIPGATGPSYSNPAYLDSGHTFVCYITTNLVCASSPVAGSNEIEIFTENQAPFTASITASTTHLTQLGQSVKFTASNTNGGAGVTYQWRKNSASITGAIYDTLVDNTLQNNDVVDCIAHTPSVCVYNQDVVSNLIVITAPLDVAHLNNAITGLKVYPNPSKGEFSVSGKLPGGSNDDRVFIVLQDMVGKVVLTESAEVHNGTFNKQMSISNNIADGVYFLRLKTNMGYQTTRIEINK